MNHAANSFGSMVFHDALMREKLPKDTYRALKKSMETGTHLELDVANVVAGALKEWALSKGVTHFTHWFQPMTGITAEKHDSFISPTGDGRMIMEFSGHELVRGEPDASSFPSGGLRATFEARGYTVWDVSSHAFIKDNTLCIPTAFCSYSGEALDKKTPLLRSMQALDREAMRIVKLFGNKKAKRVIAYAGPEQEYFLIDKEMFKKRPDLIHTGRTLFGARPPKGQEMEDHYFGNIKPKVLKFMEQVDEELWKLGVPSKTRHNEVAPTQHELAIIYASANIATDYNQLSMEVLKKIADQNGLACLLHEKPFAGVNGSGKHNNWSIATDTGQNLLEPGDTPHDNAQFLLFLLAVIKAVDLHQDLLRMSASSAGNDHRLGANEAPPATVCIFFGGTLDEIFARLAEGHFTPGNKAAPLEIGVKSLPPISRHSGDRNRTSPLAFTGNKFEFRAVGASQNPAGSTTVINTIVAESLDYMATKLEAAVAGGQDFHIAVQNLIIETVREHKDIIFSGDCYSKAWRNESERRGLPNLPSTAECLPHIDSNESIALFTQYKVFSVNELHSRFEIIGENYNSIIRIEAATTLEVAVTMILPTAFRYKESLLKTATSSVQKTVLAKLDVQIDALIIALDTLREKLAQFPCHGTQVRAYYCRDEMLPVINAVRNTVDTLEELVDDDLWPLPTYTELLFSR